MSQETVYSILFTLWQRHEDAAKYYKRLQDQLPPGGLAEWVEELGSGRDEMAAEIRSFLENSAPIPVRNKSRSDTRSLLHQQWSVLESALRQENTSALIGTLRKNEEALSSYYQESLGSKGIPEGLRDLLQQHHQYIMKMTRKLERLETVPQQGKKQ